MSVSMIVGKMLREFGQTLEELAAFAAALAPLLTAPSFREEVLVYLMSLPVVAAAHALAALWVGAAIGPSVPLEVFSA